MPLNVLINGAGICGPALATLLLRSDPAHDVTVVERSPALRTGGQQIDLRHQGIPIVRKLGLLDKVKARTLSERGLALVDAQGRQKAFLGKNDSGKGQQAFVSEYEIMRGDLQDVLFQESVDIGARARDEGKGGGVRYAVGKYATEYKQDDAGVDVVFSDGSTGRYDLVVGADGQSSRTRRMIFGDEEGRAAFKSFGLWVAFYDVPRTEVDDDVARVFVLPSRTVSTRTAGRPVTQVYLGIMHEIEKLKDSPNKSIDEQKAIWKSLFESLAWQHDRLVVDGITNTESFYVAEQGQVKMNTWHKGRVVLMGDAGYGPSNGMGTTASLVGAYVLAGELARHGDNIELALQSHERVLQPFIDAAQKSPLGAPDVLYPKSDWGIWFLQTLLGVVTKLKIDQIANRLLPEDKGGWQVPEYPELNLES
ncbi:hypothetical protein F5Y15DRAFT_430995 [Xylariaceae sp. FL0016]|nr:hypothetical protein F5Y15DRAFT_430995 [Xylariaceae sp. FL0016]